jgi:hypothetical protein
MKESDVQAIPNDDDFHSDLLKGGERIAAFIKEPYRKTVYMLERGYLPGHKVGAVWYARKSKLRARYLGEDGGA